MTSEIKLTGIAAQAAGPALASAKVTSARENPAKPAVSVTAQDSAALSQAGFARAQDNRDARFESVVKARTETSLMVSAEQKLTDMKAGIESVVKRYPPYPSNSPERLALLNDVVGLRKQVEALMVPADPDKAGEAGKGEVDNERKQYLRELMGLPEWPLDNISDNELVQMLGQVDQALTAVTGTREAMWADVVDRVSDEEVKLAGEIGQRSGRELAEQAGSISQDKQALADLA
jgi:hypothetical protein